jgi:hypothetical protein
MSGAVNVSASSILLTLQSQPLFGSQLTIAASPAFAALNSSLFTLESANFYCREFIIGNSLVYAFLLPYLASASSTGKCGINQ